MLVLEPHHASRARLIMVLEVGFQALPTKSVAATHENSVSVAGFTQRTPNEFAESTDF